MADQEFLAAKSVETATRLYTQMTQRGTLLLDQAENSIPTALDEVERRAQVVSGLRGTVVDTIDPETGVRVTGVAIGQGNTVVVTTAASFDMETGVLVTGLSIGGIT